MSTEAVVHDQQQLTPDALLAASTARPGLRDFGDPAFREGLDLLLSDIRALDLEPACVQATAWRIGSPSTPALWPSRV